MENSIAKLQWHINDFQWQFEKSDLISLMESKNGFLEGKRYCISNMPDLQYFIRIYPNGDNEEHRGMAAIFFYVIPKNAESKRNITANITISVESANFWGAIIFEKNPGAGILCSTTDNFFDSTKKFFVNDKITIKINGTLKNEQPYDAEDLEYPVDMEWKFKKADLILLKDSEKGFLSGDCFCAFTIPGLQYYVKIYPNGFDDETHEYTCLIFYVNGLKERKIKAEYTLSVESANYSKNLNYIYEIYEGSGAAICKTADFFETKNNYFINDEIKVKVKGTLKTGRSLYTVCPIDSEWKFNIADLMSLENKYLFGKRFYSFNIPGLRYYIGIYPNDSTEKVAVYFCVNGSNERKILTEFEIFIESANFSKRYKHIYDIFGGRGILLKTSDFFEPKNNFFVNGEITVKVKGILKAEKSMAEKPTCPISMQWKIKEEDLKAKIESNGFLRSKRICLSSFSNVKYFLSIYSNRGKMVIYLNIETGDEKKIKAVFDFSVDSVNFNSGIEYVFERSTGRGNILCPTIDLLDPLKGYIVDGFLTVNFHGILIIEKDQNTELDFHNDLVLNYYLLNQETDFTIVVGEKEIKVHKQVLVEASPVFAAMFESGMKEAIENKMIIKEEDFSVEVVDAAFNIYYNLNFPQNFAFENMLSVYKFADKYDIKFITNHLEDYLIKNISTSNVCQLEKFSTDFNVTKLHQSCVDFLIKCLQENIPILGADSLEKDFVFSLFLKTLSPVVETDTSV